MRFFLNIPIFLALFSIDGIPNTINIPADYPTIQQGIDAAVNGDTVLVDPGTYVENIDFKGKEITVASSKGADVTVIDGNQKESVVRFASNEPKESVLAGFTISNGAADYGGGIYCDYKSSPTIIKNTITGNRGDNLGGGIYCDGASPLISNNKLIDNIECGIVCYSGSSPDILNNSIEKNSLYGIYCLFNFSSPDISHNTISENLGGGIDCTWQCSPSITGNVITKNSTAYSGGGIECGGNSWSYIANNIISMNSAEKRGGGINCYSDTLLTITNNTITGNSANQSGGGIYCSAGSSHVITNNILWNNTAPSAPEIYTPPGAVIKVEYCDVQGGWPGKNIDQDPHFADPLQDDFHITSLSPCINRGTNEDAPYYDFDGNPRPCMGTVDMGAYEFTAPHLLECDNFFISESVGGVLHFALNGGVENAGRNYLIYGSVSGTIPGTLLPGGMKILPMNWDLFTNIVANVNYPNSIIFEDFFGTLDSKGQMTAMFNTNGPVPGMAGYVVSFAYPLQGPPWDFASNPINVEVLP